MRMLRALTLDAGLNGKGSSGYEDGIHLDFARGTYYVKAANNAPTNAALTSLFTFTGGNQSMYMGPSGLLVQSVTNTPRIEYDANGNCLGLLMEAARTNLCPQSQTLGTTWGTVTASISSNSGVSTAPDGSSTADVLVEDATPTTVHQVSQGITFTALTVYTFSIWAKARERSFIELRYSAGFGSVVLAYFNLTTGAVGTTSGTTSTSVTAYQNGWYRCSITATSGAAPAGGEVVIRLANADGGETYSGDNTSGVYLWGAQVEAGAFHSSYIPTTTGSVARTADRCLRTLGSEFSASAGTLVVQGDVANSVGATPAIVALHNNAGTGAEEMILYANAGARRWIVTDGGVAQGNVLAGSITDGASGKMAAVYTANDLDLAVNGVMSGVQDTSATLPTVTRMDLMRQDASAITLGHILRLDYWPERKSNTYLQQATF